MNPRTIMVVARAGYWLAAVLAIHDLGVAAGVAVALAVLFLVAGWTVAVER